jgi:hypothetical protein
MLNYCKCEFYEQGLLLYEPLLCLLLLQLLPNQIESL